MKTKEFLSRLYEKNSCRVLDVGARGGFRGFPHLHTLMEVHALEPEPQAAAALRNLPATFRNQKIHELALGTVSGTGMLNITRHPSMSSLLQPDKTEFDRGFGEMKNAPDWSAGMQVEKQVSVKTETLQTFFEREVNAFVDFLKLDTQGNELDILRSGEQMLRDGKVGVICTEAAWFPVYKGQSYFSEIDVFLRGCGFRFVEFRSYPEALMREDEFSATRLYERPKAAPVGDAWYVFNWTESADAEMKKRSAVLLASEGYFSEAAFLLKNVLSENEQQQLFRDLSTTTREPRFRHFLRRWTPPAIQQWRAKRRK